MPGIAQKINSSTGADDIESNTGYPLIGNGTLPFQLFNGSSISSNRIWSTHGDDMGYYQLQKFWCELTPQARRSLLRIDKQTLFEHARKNMYCSRCNGLLLEVFLQIVMYAKSLQPDPAGGNYSLGSKENSNVGHLFGLNNCEDDAPDPSVHPWGGLTATRDGTLTLLDCYLYSKSLTGLQNVFDCARSRERERELLYPDACGGGARGWISHGNAGYGRGHGTRETCALHTARLSVETLVDFWSALGEETQQSLLRMKEEDFIERLMYRFDSKRFCRDCRRNVIREFKELKELKRLRRETRCTSWFCVADTAFEYEVSHDTVQADWHQTFSDNIGAYHHFEWAIGTGEGKTDILEFENVGLSRRVQVNGLDLSGLNTCHITVRAWKIDGRCTEMCVKAHALRDQLCVHCRLVVGDGFVTITSGESITTFFEHAEEAEEEEDDFMDKEGNELDDECSRPQKHAKSPELAREFLLDAATIIFKEQVEKAFREGTARQNAHSIFVCLALKLLEERVHIACKEIITLEKQIKLLEEEEKEKRQEEERKERRRTKEREKKLRRKERLRGRESQESKCAESNLDFVVPDALKVESNECIDEGVNAVGRRDSASETGETTPSSPYSPKDQGNLLLDKISSNIENSSEEILEGDHGDMRDWSKSFHYDNVRCCSRSKPKFCENSPRELNLKFVGRREGVLLSETRVFASKYESRYHADGIEPARCNNGFGKQVRANTAYNRNGSGRSNEKFECTNNRSSDAFDSQAYNCNHHHGHRSRPEYNTRMVQDPKYVSKLETQSDISKPFYRGSKYAQSRYRRESNGQAKSKVITANSPNAKKVWEPLNSSKKCIRSNSDSDVTLRLVPKVEPSESSSTSSDEVTDISIQTNHEDCDAKDSAPVSEHYTDVDSGIRILGMSKTYPEGLAGDGGSMTESPPGASDSSVSVSSNSDNCSSCHSEGDSNISTPQNLESESTSDSEESGQIINRSLIEHCLENGAIASHTIPEKQKTALRGRQDPGKQESLSAGMNMLGDSLEKSTSYCNNVREEVSIGAQSQSLLPQLQKQNMNLPVFQVPPMGYYHQGPGIWSANPTNGLRSFPLSSPYLFSNAYGYGLNGIPQLMDYRPLPHLNPSLLNHCHVPVFHPVSQVSGVNITESAKLANPSALKEDEHIIRKVASNGCHVNASTVGNAEQNGKHDKSDAGNNGFSLFHFGGPVALSTGVRTDPAYLREGMCEKTSAEPVADCYSCNKEDSVEEYNLFDATNGIKFSIF